MRDDPTARMWLHACELLEQAEGLQRQFFRLTGSQSNAAGSRRACSPRHD